MYQSSKVSSHQHHRSSCDANKKTKRHVYTKKRHYPELCSLRFVSCLLFYSLMKCWKYLWHTGVPLLMRQQMRRWEGHSWGVAFGMFEESVNTRTQFREFLCCRKAAVQTAKDEKVLETPEEVKLTRTNFLSTPTWWARGPNRFLICRMFSWHFNYGDQSLQDWVFKE